MDTSTVRSPEIFAARVFAALFLFYSSDPVKPPTSQWKSMGSVCQTVSNDTRFARPAARPPSACQRVALLLTVAAAAAAAAKAIVWINDAREDTLFRGSSLKSLKPRKDRTGSASWHALRGKTGNGGRTSFYSSVTFSILTGKGCRVSQLLV